MKASAPTVSSKYLHQYLLTASSRHFIFSFVTSQFFPNWEYFGADLLKIDFKPFGKANVSINVAKIMNLHEFTQSSLRMVMVDGVLSVNMVRMNVTETKCRPVSSIRLLSSQDKEYGLQF